MAIWFEGANDIQCDLQRVMDAFDDLGKLYLGVVSLMPGLSDVELVEVGTDFVIIKTNEGLMKRTNISRRVDAEQLVVELQEVYQAGKRVTVTSSSMDEFTASAGGVTHRTVISDLRAPGFLGFLFRLFGRGSTGKAFLKAYKVYFEQLAGKQE